MECRAFERRLLTVGGGFDHYKIQKSQMSGYTRGGCNSLSSEYCKQGLSVYYNTFGGIRYYFLLRYIVYNNQDLFTKHYVQILSNCQPNIYFQTAVFAPVVPPCSP